VGKEQQKAFRRKGELKQGGFRVVEWGMHKRSSGKKMSQWWEAVTIIKIFQARALSTTQNGAGGESSGDFRKQRKGASKKDVTKEPARSSQKRKTVRHRSRARQRLECHEKEEER